MISGNVEQVAVAVGDTVSAGDLLCRFDGAEKLGKRLKKATDVAEYRSITHEIFQNCPMKPALEPDW